ncbi:MAG: outer membrane protein assembly factor BamE [Steroidobacteraceae bacterium]|jgi:outer membrane protein assembly factor BamE|nr:outer membrane protein assembly factor BamE [Steroidobacteraceae bacterium]
MVQARLTPPRPASSYHRSPAGRLVLACLAAALLAASGGCVYRMTVQQGNYLDPKQVSQLQVGMTRSQVRFLLGTPMLPDAFDRDRWDYLYFQQVGRLKRPDQRRLTVFFEEDKVARFENVGTPLDTPKTLNEVEAMPDVPPELRPPMPAPVPGADPSSPAT